MKLNQNSSCKSNILVVDDNPNNLKLLTLRKFNQQTHQNFALRTGINIGSVVTSAIGLTKFIYDLWGDTVNFASRIESTGVPNEIQVTEAVSDRLGNKFRFTERGTVIIKGKGKTMTYFLKSRY